MLESTWLRVFPSSKTQALCNWNVCVCESYADRVWFGERKGILYAIYGIVVFKLENNTDRLW